MESVESALRCLVDGWELLELLRGGSFDRLAESQRLATGRLTYVAVQDCGSDIRTPLAHLITSGRLEVLDASALELAQVLRWTGSGSVSAAELELIALVLAGKGTLQTRDVVVMRVLSEFGIDLESRAGNTISSVTAND